MKKFLPALLILFYSSTLLLSSANPAHAQSSNPITQATNALTCTGAKIVDEAAGIDIPFSSSGECNKFLTSLQSLFQEQQDGPWYAQNPSQFAAKVLGGDQSEIFGERYTYAQINWIINSIATMLNPAAGIRTSADLFKFLTTVKNAIEKLKTGQIPTLQEYAQLGPAGLFAGGISALYTNPPASGIGEVKYMASRLFDIGTGVQPAYAQGYGFTGLGGGAGANSAVRALWTASRNMSYLIMVILLVASGFLIMFRVKINPQTVVSLQTMIPKLIITMLLVTFSFAIAGLVIDLIYVVIVAFIGMLPLSGKGIITDPTNLIKTLTDSNYGSYIVLQTFGASIFLLMVAVVALGVSFFSGGTLAMPATIITALIIVVAAIYYLIVLWKIFWMLIKSYVMIILQICIGPLQIMLDLIPGQQGFGSWIRNIIANASVFVVIPILLVIQKVLSWDPFTNAALGINDFGAMGGVNLGLPFLGGNALSSWNLLTRVGIGFVILSITPKVADMIRDALKIPAFKYGTAVGEAFGFLRPVQELGRQGAIRGGAGQLGSMVEKIPEQYQGKTTRAIASGLKSISAGDGKFKL